MQLKSFGNIHFIVPKQSFTLQFNNTTFQQEEE